MSDLSDIRIDRTPELRGPEPRRSRVPWVLVGVLLIAAAAAAYILIRNRGAQPQPATGVVETKVPVRSVERPPLGGPAENIDVPPLDQTDPLVRQLIATLSSHPRVAAWLATDDLVRNFTVVVENIAGGTSPARHVKVLAPQGPFRVVERGQQLYIDPRSYQRYDTLADAVGSIDAAGSARVYATLRPRIEEAHRELGGIESFDRTLERAIRRLLDTPIPRAQAAVEPKGIGYGFADQDSEALSAAEKQLLRMGPRNVAIIQDKLREIARALGITDIS
jgi:hypothetical protein